MFWNHSKQHSSKTHFRVFIHCSVFWNHSKQHSSKTNSSAWRSTSKFWNHSKQHSSKTPINFVVFNCCFGTIRNSTALKQTYIKRLQAEGFGTIRNSTALKRVLPKPTLSGRFGTIRNSTALKPRGPIFLTKSRNRAICLSQTSVSNSSIMLVLLYLKNLDFSTFLNNLKTYSCNFFLQIFC